MTTASATFFPHGVVELSRAEQLASDIDAALHGGQRSPDRYKLIIPLIEEALFDAWVDSPFD